MRNHHRHAAILLLLLAVAAGPLLAKESGEATGGEELWNDPGFQKQFLGSYGINSDLEPRITNVEREQMQKILQLRQDGDLDAAVAELEALISGDDGKRKKKRRRAN